MPQPDTSQLSGVITDLQGLIDNGARISLGQVVDTLGARGFGPLLVVLSAILILPVGMVPGMPGLVALIMMAIGLHILTGFQRLWLPERVRNVSIPSDVMAAGLKRAQPVARRLRYALNQRFTRFIDNRLYRLATSVILLATGATIFLIGFVPGLPFVLSIHVLLIGLGLTARDGIVSALGMIAILPAAWLIVKFAL